jgi:hypothetical protein
MPLFKRSDPSLDELVRYVVDRALARGATLTQTKLVKLIYLIDVERIRLRTSPLSGLEWVFFYYGPYAFPLAEAIDRMEGSNLSIRRLPRRDARGETALYVGVHDKPDAERWPVTTKATVDKVVDRWAPEDLNLVLDHVYFETAPMLDAMRGRVLDMSKAASESRSQHAHPLSPPPRPADADDRIAHWLERRHEGRQELEPANYDEDYWRAMRTTSGEPDGDPPDQPVLRGRLRVEPIDSN